MSAGYPAHHPDDCANAKIPELRGRRRRPTTIPIASEPWLPVLGFSLPFALVESAAAAVWLAERTADTPGYVAT
jgi:hypothetical protein